MVTLDQDPLFFLPGETTVLPEDPLERPVDPGELQLRRRIARLAFVPHNSTYADLGGGTEQAEFEANDLVYGKFLDNYEPWKTDIAQVFNQFNLPMLLDPNTLMSMTQEHKRVLAHHFTRYVDTIGSRSRVLRTPGSAASEDFAAYGFNGDDADAKASAYGEELEELHDVLTRSPVHKQLREISIKDKPLLARRNAFLTIYKERHGVPVLVLDKQSNKYRFIPIDDKAPTDPS